MVPVNYRQQSDKADVAQSTSQQRGCNSGTRPTPPCRLLLRPVSRDVYNSMLQSTSSSSFLRSQSVENDSRCSHQVAPSASTVAKNIGSGPSTSHSRHRGRHDLNLGEERRQLCHHDSSVDSQLSTGSPTWVSRSSSTRHRARSNEQQVIGSTNSVHSQTPTEKHQSSSHRRRDNSLDSVGSTVIEPSPADSTPSTSRPPTTRKKITVSCVMADIAGLVRRVRRMRFPSNINETHV